MIITSGNALFAFVCQELPTEANPTHPPPELPSYAARLGNPQENTKYIRAEHFSLFNLKHTMISWRV